MAQKTAPVQKPTFLTEQTLRQFTAERVDREKGVIYGARMAGLKSLNGREYLPEAYQRAVGLYEGKPCNVDHVPPGEQAKCSSRFGIWHNVRYVAGPNAGPYGDLHFIKSHPLAPAVCEAAEREDLKSAFGMSHVAHAGDLDFGAGGKTIVKSLSEVKSCDLVAEPATTGGIFESANPETVRMKTPTKALLESCAQWPFQKSLAKEIADDPGLAGALAEEIEIAEGATTVDQTNTVFAALASRLIAADLNPTDKGKALATLAERRGKFLGEALVMAAPAPVPVPESKPIGAMAAAKLLEAQGVKDASTTELALLADEPEAKAARIAEELARARLKRPEQKPASGTREPITETTTSPKPAQNPDELAARIA
jgi:hypothetical protein